jgi:D-alanyl-D-alanine carboxypeptidase (penicillin-binding protein 5/6)
MRRRIIATSLLLLALSLLVLASLLEFTSWGQTAFVSAGIIAPTPTPTPTPLPTPIPTPTPTPQPVLTVQGPPPQINASAVYLMDEDTSNILDEVNAEKTLPMASTTKIMTALIAIQTADLDQPIPVKQDAVDRVILDDGSSAGLVAGDTLPLKDMLYALLLPSGDDAAYAIADELGGTQANFVQRMNLFAFRLHLFQTHYSNPDGLTLDNNLLHYTTARDLATLTSYAMHIPLFAQIVKTQHYTFSTAQHTYTWNTTNTLLATYSGMTGVKTGHTDAAGYCLVFTATRNNHHLIGIVLNSPNELQRNQDVSTLLNWGFNLPLRPPALD